MAHKIQVLSPDGFTLERDVQYYDGKKLARAVLRKWKKRYKKQGYYSSARDGRIPYDDIYEHITFRNVTKEVLKEKDPQRAWKEMHEEPEWTGEPF